jgi:hypothetical protein
VAVGPGLGGWRDQYGYPAFCCATDHAELRPVDPNDDAGTVLECPTCGYRTDTPGRGTLGDAFDVIHRQWGLRADPHVWAAVRDRLADTPTPVGEAAIRAAFVAAIDEVADVDIDTVDEPSVYRPHLNHGGMSGGHVDVGWWRTKGLPLLVARATARRPDR